MPAGRLRRWLSWVPRSRWSTTATASRRRQFRPPFDLERHRGDAAADRPALLGQRRGDGLRLSAHRPRRSAPPGPRPRAGRLLASLQQRAPSFVVSRQPAPQGRRRRRRSRSSAPAVSPGTAVRTRSVHVYKGAAEYVIDAYARPKSFQQARTEAFDPMLATLRLGGFPEGPVSGGVKAPATSVPELPEVETIRRQLEPELLGRTIEAPRGSRPPLVAAGRTARAGAAGQRPPDRVALAAWQVPAARARRRR